MHGVNSTRKACASGGRLRNQAIFRTRKTTVKGNMVDAQGTLIEADAVLARLGSVTDPALEEHLYAAWLRKAQALNALGRQDEAMAQYDAMLAWRDAAINGHPPCHAQALIERGDALGELGRHREAMAAYDEVARRFGSAGLPDVRQWVALAAYRHAAAQGSLSNAFSQVDSVRACDEIIERFGRDSLGSTRFTIARVRLLRGILLGELGHMSQQLEAYEAVVRDYADAPEPEVRSSALQAGVNLCVTLNKLGRLPEAIAAVRAPMQKYKGAIDTAVRAQHINVGCNLANVLDADGFVA